MHWLLTGGGGMLGREAAEHLRSRGHSVAAVDRAHLDITDPHACLSAVHSADVVLNCAAWTAVDEAEDAEADAFTVNAVGAGNLARAARRVGARIVHVSTDYVFDGKAHHPYDEDAPLSPCSAYGRTKAAGEWAVRAEQPDHLVVRTAWLYGAHGRCFPKTIARRAAEVRTISVVDDQWGQPTWTVDVARILVELVETGSPAGVYHATATGSTTWCGFARDVMAAAGHDRDQVRAVSSASYVTRAARPRYSVLAHGALERCGIAPIGHWKDRWKLAAERVLG